MRTVMSIIKAFQFLYNSGEGLLPCRSAPC